MSKGGFLRHRRDGSFHGKTASGAPYSTRRETVVASASVVTRAQIRRVITTDSWQTELWDFYDTVGEVRFATSWLANAVSRCGLYVGTFSDSGDPTPVSDDSDAAATTARELLNALHYGPVGQAEMLRRLTLHLSIPGESYLIGMDSQPSEDVDGRRWYVASADEIKVGASGATLTLPDTGQQVVLTEDNSTIIRLWRPHARHGWKPDSTLRASIPVLREAKSLSDHLAATLDSRLAGAGILFVSTEATLPSPSQSEGDTDPMHADPFTAALMEAMLTPISDRDDASAVVPLVAKLPGDQIDKVKHLRFDTELSDKVTELRNNALERFAAGADLPKEFVTGTGSMNHWGVAQLEDSAVKLYIEPLVACICDALTQQYLWPALRAAGLADVEQYVIWFSSAELTQRPNKGPEAQALWDKGVLSDAALLRENGFSNEDAPTPIEHQRWLEERLLLSSSPAHIAPTTPEEEVPTATTAPTPRELPSTPATPEPDTARAVTAAAEATATRDPEIAWWLRAVEQATLRALELSGKRLLGSLPREHRHRSSPMRQVPAWEIHTVAMSLSDEQIEKFLDGAYDTAQVNFGTDACVLSTIDEYCRDLLRSGTPHRREYLAGALARSGCAPTLVA